MTSAIGKFRSGWKRRSRLVRMPTSLPLFVIGMPEIEYFSMTASAWPIFASGGRVTGSTIMPDSDRFTMLTSSACRSMVIFLWIIPIPPSRAIAIASLASVTVSIAADNNGTFSAILPVSRVFRLTWAGRISEYAGTSSTSSKVNARSISPFIYSILSYIFKKNRHNAGYKTPILDLAATTNHHLPRSKFGRSCRRYKSCRRA